jgi:hypothetical protein
VRVIAETLVTLVFTALLTIVAVALFQAGSGGDLGAAVDSAWRLIGTGAGIAFVLWTVALLIGNIATRRRGWVAHVVLGFGTALLAALVNGGVALVIAAVAPSEFSWLFAVASLVALVAFLVAALVALLLTHLVIVRRRPVTTSETAEAAPADAPA